MSSVLYMPSLDTKLLSCSEMDRQGYNTIFGDGECQLTCSSSRDALILAKRRGGVYELIGSLSPEPCNIAAESGKKSHTFQVWHNLLGHIGVSTV